MFRSGYYNGRGAADLIANYKWTSIRNLHKQREFSCPEPAVRASKGNLSLL